MEMKLILMVSWVISGIKIFKKVVYKPDPYDYQVTGAPLFGIFKFRKCLAMVLAVPCKLL